MPEYVSIPTITDPDALAQDSYDYLETKVPNWRPHDGQLDTWLIAAAARMVATLNDTMTDVEARIFRYLGANVFEISPLESRPATATSTWTMVDNTGHTIPIGTAVAMPNEGGELVGFETLETVVVPPGSSVAKSVPIGAIEAGVAGNEIGKAGAAVTLLDQLAYVTTITLNVPTSGGQDDEEDEAYLNRLVSELRLQTPRPIIPKDFSELARVIPGVHRALALNGYNPDNGMFTNERTVAMAVVDLNGEECNVTIKKEVEELLLSKREVNFIIKMISVTYTIIGVEYQVKKWAEWNSEDVLNRINEALTLFLGPRDWGKPPFGDDIIWYQREAVKLNDIIATIGNVQGVEDVLSVKLRKGVEAFGNTDIILPGVASLPRPGEMKGSVV